MTDAATFLGLLADDDRLKVVAALALGATSPAAIRSATGLDARTVGRTLARFQDAGLVAEDGAALRLDLTTVREAARAAAAEPDVYDTDAETAKVLRAFLRDGRLVGIPASHAKRRVLLEHVVQVFEPGDKYTEKEVNALIRAFTDDYVTIRRYLVDAELLARENGVYWRIGGPVPV